MSDDGVIDGLAEPGDNDLALALTEQQYEVARGAPTLPAEIFPRDPVTAFKQARELVQMMHELVRDSGESRFVSRVEGRPYPQVTWWTTVGLPLQLLPQIRWSRRIDTAEGSGYADETWQSRCEVVHTPTGNVVASGEGLCSASEELRGRRRWTDSHAIMAMSQTRAIGRTFRQCLAGLAVMAGLEATPAEEMTPEMLRKDKPAGGRKGKATASRAAAPPADAVAVECSEDSPAKANELEKGVWLRLGTVTDVKDGWYRVAHIHGGLRLDDGVEPPSGDAKGMVAVAQISRSGVSKKNGSPWAAMSALVLEGAPDGDADGDGEPEPTQLDADIVTELGALRRAYGKDYAKTRDKAQAGVFGAGVAWDTSRDDGLKERFLGTIRDLNAAKE